MGSGTTGSASRPAGISSSPWARTVAGASAKPPVSTSAIQPALVRIGLYSSVTVDACASVPRRFPPSGAAARSGPGRGLMGPTPVHEPPSYVQERRVHTDRGRVVKCGFGKTHLLVTTLTFGTVGSITTVGIPEIPPRGRGIFRAPARRVRQIRRAAAGWIIYRGRGPFCLTPANADR